jgi:hypothetical protein
MPLVFETPKPCYCHNEIEETDEQAEELDQWPKELRLRPQDIHGNGIGLQRKSKKI